jgi:hypothetical protein
MRCKSHTAIQLSNLIITLLLATLNFRLIFGQSLYSLRGLDLFSVNLY